MKRVLPSHRSLEMFEAAARHLSFTRAAEDLAVTQSALSRQIALLEVHLGVRLFERIRKRVVLTAAGAHYAEKVRQALDRLRSVTMDMLTAGAGGEVLHVASLSTFAALWLAPRLVSFTRAHPDIVPKVTTYHHQSYPVIDPEADAVIYHGEPSWPGCVVELLLPETIVSVCSPQFLARHPLRTLGDLDRVPLIHQTTYPEAWIHWLAAVGAANANALRGPAFEQYTMIIEAAISGLGVATVPSFLIEEHLAAGRLVMPYPHAVRSLRSYYLATPESRRTLPKVEKFRKWVLREARAHGNVAKVAPRVGTRRR